MMLALEHFETTAQRLTRWTAAAGIVVAAHAIAALAIWYWPDEAPKTEHSSAITMDLPPLAAESPSDQTNVSDSPQIDKSAPPPSPVDDAQEKPSEAEPEKATEPSETPPEPTTVSAADPPVEQPPVEEAPLAPEPEVTLPKVEELKTEKPNEEKPKEEKAEKKPAQKPDKPKIEKSAPKSESKQQRQAAASASGKFDPNPIYRASPVYPPSALGKISGYVAVSYTVTPSGSVTGVSVIAASPPGVFTSAAITAIQRWRFRPSATGGRRSTTLTFKAQK